MTFLSYDEAMAAGVDRVGGKAWNLARAARWGLPTPQGIAVSVDNYRDLMCSPDIAPLIGQITTDISAIAGDEVRTALERIRAAILAKPFSEFDRNALVDALAVAGLDRTPLAVRSSATGEDGSTQAFAGIHESVLGVSGTDNLVAAIRRCQASLWTPQALAYRRKFGIADTEVNCGVLICAMVLGSAGQAPAAAGVAFTADPATGDCEVIHVEAVAGLADKLVGGSVEPSTYRFAVSVDGVAPASTLPEAPLSKAVALDVARLAWRIHWAFGDGDHPQDIEWVFDGALIFVVQVRPVTALPVRTFSAIADQPVIWSNGNFKEVLPQVLTPMGWSYMKPHMQLSLTDTVRDTGFSIPSGMIWLRRIDGHAYCNSSAYQWLFYDAFGLPPAHTIHSMGGSQPEIASPRDDRPRRAAWTREQRKMKLGRVALALAGSAPQLLAEGWREIRRLRQTDLRALSDQELGDALASMAGSRMRASLGTLSAVGEVWLSFARGIAERLMPKERSDAMIGALMSGLGGAHSADHAYALQEIMRTTTPESTAFEEKWRVYLDEYGHRGFDELEIASPRWNEEPEALLELGSKLAAGHHDRQTAAKVRADIEKQLRTLFPPIRWILRWLTGRAAKGFAIREDAKSYLVGQLSASRTLIQEAGRRMASVGRLDSPEDVFFLYLPELFAFLDGTWTGNALAVVDDRKLQMRDWLAIEIPDVVVEGGQSPLPEPIATVEKRAKDGTWLGIAASPGLATGRARVLKTPLDGRSLAVGEILVAPTTDPSWTPLFLIASGLAVETGGYLSHGAIVAREFGIPAVVNIPGIIDQISSGAKLEVDGNRGAVTRSAE